MSQVPSFTGAMKQYFGFKEGPPRETPSEFARELKDLSYDDKMEFHRMLNVAGYPCTPPTPPAKAG